jgi:gamma-glutamyltranspeptidase / glutathione hydrolase
LLREVIKPVIKILLPLFVVVGVLVAHAPGRTFKPVVQGRRGVVTAGNPLSAEAGYRMFQKGGNAVDAGVAAVFAAAVVEQMSFGMGGEAPILFRLAGKPVVAIDGTGWAPTSATPEFYRSVKADDPRRVGDITIPGGKPGIIPSHGPLSAVVPGAVDGLITALKQGGRLSFSEVIQPAIELAQGFPVDERLAHAIAQHQATLEKWPDSARVFLPNGKGPKEGDVLVQEHLAATLKEMAAAEKRAPGDRGAKLDAVRDYFYKGPVATRIAAFCKSAGCLITERDMNEYHTQNWTPSSTNYRGIEVYKMPFWSQGPVMIENLNMLEGFDLRQMGQNSAQYIHTVVEAMKLGYADRDAYYGDPNFSQVPAQLLSKDYANVRRTLITDKASADHIPGDPEHMQARASTQFAQARLRDRNAAHQDTTCVNAMDKDGNMFSATPSGAWLPSVIAGDTGIPLTERANAFVLTDGHPNQIAPHKRPRITLTPGLAVRNNQPFLAWSTPGGDSQDQTLLQVFLNIADFGMNPQEAVEAPRFNSEAMYSSFDDHGDMPLTLQVERRLGEQTLNALRERGHKLDVQGDWDNPTSPTVIEFDPRTGVMRAGADVRGYRYAIAW